MRRPHLRRLAALGAAPALLLALTACGNDPSNASADLTATAPTSTSPSDSTEPTPAEETRTAGDKIDVADFADRLRAASERATTASMKMSMQVSGMKVTASGDIDYTTTPPSMQMVMNNPVAGGKMDIRLVDGDFYMNMGELSGDMFYKSSMAEMAEASGQGDLTEQLDPVKQFEAFSDGVKQVTYLGTDTVGGEELGQYELEIDTAKVAGLDEAATAAPGVEVPERLVYRVWLDGEDRMRQAVMDMGDLGSMKMQVFDWGKPVDIQAPPADQVTEMPGQ